MTKKMVYLLVHHYGTLAGASTVVGCYPSEKMRATVRKALVATMGDEKELEDVDIEMEGE